ncbi:MAG: cobalamin-dependent protein [Candidatus Sericytochromatia bacterium]|nr:cobalamin-dependent protein [Candidatus Sericytochromatia bacterium]
MRVTDSLIVRLVQINQPLLRQNYLPYAAGLLQAYVQRHAPALSRYVFMPPLYQRLPLQTMLKELLLADLVGFSCYVWNSEYSLALAHLLKQAKPEILIVFGGPHVPDRADDFLKAYPWVDACVHGEGEAVFLALLERLPSRDWHGLPGLSFLDAEGGFQSTAQSERSRNLENFPSPYLAGVFEPLLKAQPSQAWIALWETNRGCPFSCSFCDWGSATQSKVIQFPEARLKGEIAWFARHQIQMVYCCDANFGLLPRDLDLAETMVKTAREQRFPKSFYVQNTKNATERAFQIQKTLCGSGLSQTVTLSLQTVTPEALKQVKRENISLETYRSLQRRFRAEAIPTYTDLLIGLPGETRESFAACISQVIAEGQHNQIKFYPVYLLPNAPMSQPAYREQYALQTVWQPYKAPYEAFSQTAGTGSEVEEKQEMLIATNSMSREDWQGMRILAWLYELHYFNRHLLQLPLLLMHGLTGLSFAKIFQGYLEHAKGEITSPLLAFLRQKAAAIQTGEPELCVGLWAQGQKVWLTVEDFLLTGLVSSGALPDFFAEQEAIFAEILSQQGKVLPPGLLSEAVGLAHKLAQYRLQPQPFSYPLSSNLWAVYQGLLRGEKPELCFRPETFVWP